MIGKKTNEIAGCARGEAGRETEIGGKAHKMRGNDEFLKPNNERQRHVSSFKVFSIQFGKGPILENVPPHLVPLPEERMKVSDALGCVKRVENSPTGGLSGVAAADPADTAALRGEKGEDQDEHDYYNH